MFFFLRHVFEWDFFTELDIKERSYSLIEINKVDFFRELIDNMEFLVFEVANLDEPVNPMGKNIIKLILHGLICKLVLEKYRCSAETQRY